ncbi:MAG: hypothetical protein Q7S03_00230 [bacterium]|nr:hypothetical protein [bacterium]
MKKLAFILVVVALTITACDGLGAGTPGVNPTPVVSAPQPGTTPTSGATPTKAAPVPTVATPVTSAPKVSTWPTTPKEAAAAFGATEDRWEKTAEGRGWHMIEKGNTTRFDPTTLGTVEGYFDTNPGRDAKQIVSSNPVDLQGGTVWPLADASAQVVFCAMWNQKFGRFGVTFDSTKETIDAVGFTKPAGCVGQQPTNGAPAPTPPPTGK